VGRAVGTWTNLTRLTFDCTEFLHERESCQQSVFLLLRTSAIGCIWLTYAEYERVTDGARTRDLRSHNPKEQVRIRPTLSCCVAYLSRKASLRGAGCPCVSGSVLESIAAALLPLPLRLDARRSPFLRTCHICCGILVTPCGNPGRVLTGPR